ncbi:hypothetical protein B7W85_05890 [Allorhizobium ampelinum]|nr:hypothetical protein DXM22_00600 [Agrobacterium vitis]KAA3532341.1 hypothetical protein DXT89_03120 [Agrobacterium vitis]OVE95357.1 hypothetical protein B7W85_05890 [Allorhizobium ampelinum]RCU53676.1 hypothetical protein ASB66_011265 [Agrobacterium vitis]
MEQFLFCRIKQRVQPKQLADGQKRDSMNRTNGLYLIIGALVVIVVGLGAYAYHEETKPKGVELSIGKDGVAVEQK